MDSIDNDMLKVRYDKSLKENQKLNIELQKKEVIMAQQKKIIDSYRKDCNQNSKGQVNFDIIKTENDNLNKQIQKAYDELN